MTLNDSINRLNTNTNTSNSLTTTNIDLDHVKSYNYDYDYTKLSIQEILLRSGITTAWQYRKISNFDYLMHINTIAGRTFNDLTQYPVFPWILKDYTSKTIDLNDINIYRDLSKPIGALNKERSQIFIYISMKDEYEN